MWRATQLCKEVRLCSFVQRPGNWVLAWHCQVSDTSSWFLQRSRSLQCVPNSMCICSHVQGRNWAEFQHLTGHATAIRWHRPQSASDSRPSVVGSCWFCFPMKNCDDVDICWPWRARPQTAMPQQVFLMQQMWRYQTILWHYDILCKSGIVCPFLAGLAGIAELFGSLSFQVICRQRVFLKHFRLNLCFCGGVSMFLELARGWDRMQQLSDMLRQRHCVDALCILGMICIQAVRLDRFLLTRQSSPFMSPSKPLFRLPCSVNKQPSIGAVPPVPLCAFFFSKASQKIWEIAIDLCARGVGSLVPPNEVQISTKYRDLTKSKYIPAYRIPSNWVYLNMWL